MVFVNEVVVVGDVRTVACDQYGGRIQVVRSMFDPARLYLDLTRQVLRIAV